MRHLIAINFLILNIAGTAFAQENFSAKSLFFGEDDPSTPVLAIPESIQKQKTAVVLPAPAPVPSSVSQNIQRKPAITTAAAIVKNKPAKIKPIGASYFVRLKNPDDSTYDVLSSRKFKTGERFQLGIKVNRPSYIYIMNEGPDGNLTQIYPQPGKDNFIDAMGVVFLPSKGAFEFDNIPGTEQLLVYMSATPINNDAIEVVKKSTPDIVSMSMDTDPCEKQPVGETVALPQRRNDRTELSNTGTAYASKGVVFAPDMDSSCNYSDRNLDQKSKYTAKGISFSDDSEPGTGGQVASYVVKNTTKVDASLYLKIKLTHQ